jgi:hypothetical protein
MKVKRSGKSVLLAASLFVVTAGVVALYPVYQKGNAVPGNNPPVVPGDQVKHGQARKIELVFALDTTGSMSGLIHAAKEKIWSIATNLAQAEQAPEIRIGLVAYRDRGDEYVTKVVDLSSDLDSVYAQLMDLVANGGGDGPESVNQALHEAVHKISWSQDKDAYRVIFLVGDAPPHMDYQDDVKYPVSIQAAVNRGILVNTIQCGSDPHTLTRWQSMASLGRGSFFNVAQHGNAVAMSTPYDKELATLSAEMDKTRLYYGTDDERKEKNKKLEATEKLNREATVESRARRAMFNASKSGKSNQFGSGDLVEDVTSGRADLSTLAPAKLPEPMRDMPAVEQQKLIKQKADKRASLQARIENVAKKRSAYMRKEMEKRGGAKDSLDDKIVGTLRQQASEKGLDYVGESITY